MSSLLDALLLEEPTPTRRDVFVALRADGAAGSGTATDPFDGSTRFGRAMSADVSFDPSVAIADVSFDAGFDPLRDLSLTNLVGASAELYKSFTPANFEVLNGRTLKLKLDLSIADNVRARLEPPASREFIKGRQDHNSPETPSIPGLRPYWPVLRVPMSGSAFAVFDVVRISDASITQLNGDFVVVAVHGNDCWCLLTALPEAAISSTASCAKVIHRFDDIIASTPKNCALHLGPGTFETRGRDDYRGGVALQSGQKIHGTGMSSTIIKLVHVILLQHPSRALKGRTAEFHNPASLVFHLEVCDLTIDCNLFGQPVPGGIGIPPVTVEALAAEGHYLRMERVRTINWGCQGGAESFPLGFGSPEQSTAKDGGTGNLIQHCVCEKPGESNTHETSIMTNGGNVIIGNGVGPVIRNNFVTAEYTNGFLNHPIAVVSLSREPSDSTRARLTTAEPHRHVSQKNLVVRGALTNSGAFAGLVANPFNGVFTILEIISDTELTYQMYADPAADATGATIGHAVSSEFVMVGRVEPYLSTATEVIITTKKPHGRTKGQATNLVGIYENSHGLSDVRETPLNATHATHHIITQVSSTAGNDPQFPGDPLQPNQFTVKRPPGLVAHNYLVLYRPLIGVDFHGPWAPGAIGAVVEGNQVYDCYQPIYSDTGSARDVVVRGNYWSNFGKGVNFNFSPYGLEYPARFGASLRRESANHQIAVFESVTNHGFREGDAILVEGVLGDFAADYNGTFEVREVRSATLLTYLLRRPVAGDPPLPTTGYPINIRARWQIRRMVYEGNICELYSYDARSLEMPVGIGVVAAFTDGPPFLFPGAIIRDNFFRIVDNGQDPPLSTGHIYLGAYAMGLGAFQKTLVENNVIELADPRAIQEGVSEHVTAFNNRSPDGSLIPLYHVVQSGILYEETDKGDGVSSMAEDVLVSSLL